MKITTWDLETTGLSPKKEEIVEVGMVFSDGFEINNEGGCLVKPTKKIPQEAVNIHGITTQEAKIDGFDWEAVGRRLHKRLSDSDVWCGYNLNFDIRFAEACLERIGLELERKPVIDVFNIAQRFIPKDVLHSKSLGNVCKFMGVSLTDAHRAVNDAVATLQLLEKICDDVGVDLKEALDGNFTKLGKYKIGADPIEALYDGYVCKR